jgi:DNA-binding transcriptional LysR family regulator
MEMHQVRYFLAVARLLNFTRAAEECHVAQPSLTRAIKQLEEELGGDLFRRERNLTHLSELGHRMLPLLQQCFDSAQSAKQVATSLKKGSIAPLTIAISPSVSIEVLLPFLKELVRAFSGLALRFLRVKDLVEVLKKGDAEIGVAGPLANDWDRLESWPLFEEPYKLAVAPGHLLAGAKKVALADLNGQRLLFRTHCEHKTVISELLAQAGAQPEVRHNVDSDRDFAALLAEGIGIGIAPESTSNSGTMKLLAVDGLDTKRTVYVYGVAGRQRSAAGNTLIKMMRAADWQSVNGASA